MNRTLVSEDFRQRAARLKHMPLLRSLADSVARAAINMALLTELEGRLSKPCDYKPASPMAAIPPAQAREMSELTPSRSRLRKPATCRRSGLTPLLGLVLAGLIAFVAGCGKKHEPAAVTGESLPPAAVRVQKIETVKLPALEEVVGTIQPKLQARIEAKISGRITRLSVTVGQSVKQGDLLLELATQEIQAKLEQVGATFRMAELDFNRASNLRKQSAATQAEFDAAQARYNVAKAAVAEAEAVSGYAKIVAPFDGVIVRKLADEGDLAMPGKPLLEVEGRAGLRLVADVPSLLAGRVEPGAKLSVWVDTVPDPILGAVAEISPAADPASRTVSVKVDLPVTPGLRSGQFGRLAVPLGVGAFLFVPPPALVVRGQLEILFVAANGKAQMRLVRAGKQTEQGIEILSGLAPGEAVVVEGAGLLRDGQPLQTQ